MALRELPGSANAPAEALTDVPMYQLDPVLRRAGSLPANPCRAAPAVIYPRHDGMELWHWIVEALAGVARLRTRA